MNVKTLVAALAGGIVMFGLGFLFFAVLFTNYFQENMVQYAGLMKEPPIIWAIFLFNVVWAWLIAWIADRSGSAGWAAGAMTGAITMFTVSLAMNLDFFAFLNIHKSLAPILVHLIGVTIMGAAAGAVIGLVLDYFQSKSQAA